jgi:imidazolonepropionase-like amidohydrolase
LPPPTNNFSLWRNWKHIGKIEIGRGADILVLSRNPLDKISALKDIAVLIVK